jgi:hypothetical protein
MYKSVWKRGIHQSNMLCLIFTVVACKNGCTHDDNFGGNKHTKRTVLSKSIKFRCMPGANCSIFCCTVSRRKKHNGISLLAIPGRSKVNKNKVEWRKKLLAIITRDRVIDKDLRRQINEGKLHVCEKHFRPEDIEIRK